MKELFAIATLGVVAMLGCSDQAERTASGIVESALTASPTHLLVIASYENGLFKAERVTRVAGPFVKPRSGKSRGALSFVARQGSNPLVLGGLPDPREVHVDAIEPTTGEMRHVSGNAPGKQHFLIHVPDTADTVDFYDPKPAAVAARSTAVHAAPSAADGTPIGTISLQGLL